MNRYLNEHGQFVKKKPAPAKPVKHQNPQAQKHNEKAIEENKTKAPLDEDKPEVKKGFSIKKKAKKKSE